MEGADGKHKEIKIKSNKIPLGKHAAAVQCRLD